MHEKRNVLSALLKGIPVFILFSACISCAMHPGSMDEEVRDSKPVRLSLLPSQVQGHIYGFIDYRDKRGNLDIDTLKQLFRVSRECCMLPGLTFFYRQMADRFRNHIPELAVPESIPYIRKKADTRNEESAFRRAFYALAFLPHKKEVINMALAMIPGEGPKGESFFLNAVKYAGTSAPARDNKWQNPWHLLYFKDPWMTKPRKAIALINTFFPGEVNEKEQKFTKILQEYPVLSNICIQTFYADKQKDTMERMSGYVNPEKNSLKTLSDLFSVSVLGRNEDELRQMANAISFYKDKGGRMDADRLLLLNKDQIHAITETMETSFMEMGEYKNDITKIHQISLLCPEKIRLILSYGKQLHEYFGKNKMGCYSFSFKLIKKFSKIDIDKIECILENNEHLLGQIYDDNNARLAFDVLTRLEPENIQSLSRILMGKGADQSGIGEIFDCLAGIDKKNINDKIRAICRTGMFFRHKAMDLYNFEWFLQLTQQQTNEMTNNQQIFNILDNLSELQIHAIRVNAENLFTQNDDGNEIMRKLGEIAMLGSQEIERKAIVPTKNQPTI